MRVRDGKEPTAASGGWQPAAKLSSSWAPTAASGFLLAAGILHLILLPGHLAEARGAGLYFCLLGFGQVVWAVLSLRHPSRRLDAVGLAIFAVSPIIVFAATRILRAPWSTGPEPLDFVGVATTVAEAVAAAVLGLSLARTASGARLARRSAWKAAAVGVLLGAASYAAGIAVENVPWLSEADAGHHADLHAAHADSSHPGISIVGTQPYTGPTDAAGVLAACAPESGLAAVPCYTQKLKALLVGKGALAAFDVLVELATRSSNVNAESHAIAHDLGRYAYEAYGFDIHLTLSNCSYEVFQGCLHGAQQSHFDDVAAHGGKVDDAVVKDTCPPADNRFHEYACLHGLGHGLMLYTNYGMNASLNLCDALADDFGRGSCYGGVFMENVVGYQDSRNPTAAGGHHNHGGHATPPVYMVSPTNPYHPCDAVAKKYQSTCWLMQTSLILYLNGGDFQDAASKCDGAGEYRGTCYQSLGRDAAAYAARDPVGMVERCSYGAPDSRAVCVRGFTAESILNFNDPASGIALCKQLPLQDKLPCYEETGAQSANMLAPDALQALCSTAEQGYVDACRIAAGMS